MRILIVCPLPPGSRRGNRVTAERWARILRLQQHRVAIATAFSDQPADLLIALHAVKSASSVARARRIRPEMPIIVALTGTDLYPSLRVKPRGCDALDQADRVVALQPLAARQLLPRWRRKLRVIYQSVPRTVGLTSRVRRTGRDFRVVVVGHLRTVKDPLRTAYAVRRLPAASRLDVTHVGSALTEGWKRRAEHESKTNPRWHWLGETSLLRARRLIASSDLLVLSSRSEGGAGVVGEACVAGVPIVTTRIDGSLGLLGEDYPGTFDVGDTAALTRLLLRAEGDKRFLRELHRRCRACASLFSEAREKRAWHRLIAELMPRKS